MLSAIASSLEAAVTLLAAKRAFARRLPALAIGADGARGGTREISGDSHRLARLIFRLANRMRIGCLPRALALRELLLRRGYDAEIRLGILVRDQRVFGHAWVTIGGTIVGESESLTNDFAILPLAALGSYETRDGIHWMRRSTKESARFTSRC